MDKDMYMYRARVVGKFPTVPFHYSAMEVCGRPPKAKHRPSKTMPLMKHPNHQHRDEFGNLYGGEMNLTMQSRVVGDTIQDIEARRHQASMQAQQHANFPRYIPLNDVQLPVYTFKELEDLGKATLKKRCLDYKALVEATGCRFFENHEHLKLNAAQGEDKLLEWFINVQVTLARALGMEGLDHEGFGAGHLADTLKEPPAKHNKQPQQQQQRRQPQQPQMTQEEYEQLMMQRQYHHQQMQQMQQVQQVQQYPDHEFENYSNGPPPSRGGMKGDSSMHHVSADPRDASRFEDAARIRARNSGSSNIFG